MAVPDLVGGEDSGGALHPLHPSWLPPLVPRGSRCQGPPLFFFKEDQPSPCPCTPALPL